MSDAIKYWARQIPDDVAKRARVVFASDYDALAADKADDVRRMADDANKLHAAWTRVSELEAALRRIVLKDGRESIAVTKICDIARRALARDHCPCEDCKRARAADREGEPQ
jgi:hypothetical protein